MRGVMAKKSFITPQGVEVKKGEWLYLRGGTVQKESFICEVGTDMFKECIETFVPMEKIYEEMRRGL